MIIRYTLFTILLSCLLYVHSAQGQLMDRFDDGNFTSNPAWLGDQADFIINEDNELQLNADVAGESYLYTTLSYPDTICMKLDFRLEMAPSSSNFSLIYLGLDNPDPSVANGYYLQVGESGSGDALRLYRLDAGSETLLATGQAGAIASDPAQARLCIDIYPDGLWSLSADYDVADICEFEFELMDNTYTFSSLDHFGFYCRYTESRKENFFYDNIEIKKFEPDVTPPQLLEVVVVNDNALLLTFDEIIDVATGSDINNFEVDQDIGLPSSATVDGTRVFLTFDGSFVSGISYTIAVANVMDEEGNAIDLDSGSFVLSVPPSPGDIKISEILFDPFSGGEDFVEVYNDSNKFIDLNGLIISNEDKDERVIFSETITILPGEYICITENKEFLMENYLASVESQIVENQLPSWNNDEGNVSLAYPDPSSFIDQFDYTEDMHFVLIDDTEGVSLERLSFDANAQEEGNFHSAASVDGYATPGRQNSNLITLMSESSEVELVQKVFSPNEDGDQDRLVIQYALDKPGYVANVKVFDDEGFERKQLVTNALLGSEGIMVWDGTDDEGNISEIGMYIIVVDLFHPDGDTRKFTKVCVLADFID